MKLSRNIAIVVAAGSGSRTGGAVPKQFQPLGRRPLVVHSLEFFEKSDLVDEIVLVVAEEYMAYASQAIVDRWNLRKIRKITAGGETRQESVLAGLSACPNGINLAVIHDAARPFVAQDLFRQLMARASDTGAAILAVPAKESIKMAENGIITKTLKRDAIWIAQTPQVFRFEAILKAHQRAEAAQNEATDDAELYEQYCGQVAIVHGSFNNIKITTRADFILAEEILKGLA
ncbi:MAG: 2-C-methyl-D-erythritol 4-phosphate cytidylyltransferase [candidate division Zixibacteria bacterium RBG_16_53_22]|nr:MAG: 2-C-methyl-D-erythritol 4-phosphate cytidylyltransferase [candidate division Zixibacteria bacterium RBG_16_53_22]